MDHPSGQTCQGTGMSRHRRDLGPGRRIAVRRCRRPRHPRRARPRPAGVPERPRPGMHSAVRSSRWSHRRERSPTAPPTAPANGLPVRPAAQPPTSTYSLRAHDPEFHAQTVAMRIITKLPWTKPRWLHPNRATRPSGRAERRGPPSPALPCRPSSRLRRRSRARFGRIGEADGAPQMPTLCLRTGGTLSANEASGDGFWNHPG
jgi:hypothetical protein